jgi:Zn-dependent peptidase ImmA (M78 family)
MDDLEVQQKARLFMADLDISRIQSDLSVYVRAASALLRYEQLEPGEAGFTLTKSDGTHVITVNSGESIERQRFTVCHEIAHIVLKLPTKHDELPLWSYAKRDQNEILCDIFAAELLMPYKRWKEKLPTGEPSFATIQQMASEFQASFPAAASRYASLSSIPCAFIAMESGVVRYSVRSTTLRRARAWISPRSPIPVGSVAHRLRATGKTDVETDSVAQDVWFESWEKGLDLWEMSRHYPRFDTSVSLLWFAEGDLPEIELDRFGKRVADDEGLDELTGELPWPGKRRRK